MQNVTRTVTSLGIAVILFLLCWYFISPQFGHKSPLTLAATVIKPNTQPLSGFKLISTTGQDFTQQSLKGQWTLMFFGYSTCPNICPATLGIVKEIWNKFLPEKNPPAKFVFVSINPMQDSPAELQKFVSNFHPYFIGVTGDIHEIEILKKQLGIYAHNVETNPGDANGRLIMDHTAALMLIDSQAKLRAIFTPPLDPDLIAQDLSMLTK
jgi:protein SCO1